MQAMFIEMDESVAVSTVDMLASIFDWLQDSLKHNLWIAVYFSR